MSVDLSYAGVYLSSRKGVHSINETLTMDLRVRSLCPKKRMREEVKEACGWSSVKDMKEEVNGKKIEQW